MPRRNSNAGQVHHNNTGATSLQYLAGQRTSAPPITAAPSRQPADGMCTECGRSLPPTWRYPEHAACRPERAA